MLSSLRTRFLVDEGGVLSRGEGSSMRDGVAIAFVDIGVLLEYYDAKDFCFDEKRVW